MIRRDYFMKLVQEFAQVLACVIGLKQKGEHVAALREIDRALKKIWDIDPERAGEMSLEDWIGFCRAEGTAAEQCMVALAGLFQEQGELNLLAGRGNESQQCHALALGLYLEALMSCIVSLDLLHKVEYLIAETSDAPLPIGVMRRLLGYFEARGQFARAEDILFSWRDTGDAGAMTAGEAFFGRLRGKPDQELAIGGLPRAEVEQGMKEFHERGAGGAK